MKSQNMIEVLSNLVGVQQACQTYGPLISYLWPTKSLAFSLGLFQFTFDAKNAFFTNTFALIMASVLPSWTLWQQSENFLLKISTSYFKIILFVLFIERHYVIM